MKEEEIISMCDIIRVLEKFLLQNQGCEESMKNSIQSTIDTFKGKIIKDAKYIFKTKPIKMSMESKQIENVLFRLEKHNLFLCDYYTDENGIAYDCLKDANDNVIFTFKLFPNIETLTCLRMGIDKLKTIIDNSFNLKP